METVNMFDNNENVSENMKIKINVFPLDEIYNTIEVITDDKSVEFQIKKENFKFARFKKTKLENEKKTVKYETVEV